VDAQFLTAGFIWYVVFLLSTTCHEAAHALAAKLGGDLTAFHGGQVSLDPTPHIRREPVGMVIAPILSYLMGGWMMGWASAPYDPFWARRHPHRAAWMSVAGPAANFTLVAIAAIAIHVGIWFGAFEHPQSAGFMHVVNPAGPGLRVGLAPFLSLLYSLNILLGLFNLLPIPPLDGFSAVGLLLNEENAIRLQELGARMRGFSYIGLLLAWQIFGPVFSPIFTAALNILYPGHHYGA
jgi:Zn-dependent protease